MNITKDFEETGMTFLEYKNKEEKILDSYRNRSITRKVMYMLLEDNRKAYNEWQEYRKGVIDATPMWERMEQLKRDMTGVIDVTPTRERLERLEQLEQLERQNRLKLMNRQPSHPVPFSL